MSDMNGVPVGTQVDPDWVKVWEAGPKFGQVDRGVFVRFHPHRDEWTGQFVIYCRHADTHFDAVLGFMLGERDAKKVAVLLAESYGVPISLT
jgi:hypothetical protein